MQVRCINYHTSNIYSHFNGIEDASMDLQAVTLNLPPSCRSIRDAGKMLHKWRVFLQASGNIGFTGGIFKSMDSKGSIEYHAHLIVLTNITGETLKRIWLKITKLPVYSVPYLMKPIYDLDGWLRYIYEKNAKESLDYRLTRFREEHLIQAAVFQTN